MFEDVWVKYFLVFCFASYNIYRREAEVITITLPDYAHITYVVGDDVLIG